MIPRGMTWVGHVARLGEMRNVYRISVGKPGGKRMLKCRWEDNIRMCLEERG